MNKKKKYSYTATTSAILIIVAIIILNLIMSVLSDKINLKIDLTKDSILSFSETTEKVIDELEDEVNIISLIPLADNSSEMIQIDEVLKKYEVSSSKINYERVDTKRNPAVLNKYTVDGKPLESDYNVVFESDKKYEVVNVNDLIMMYKDTQTDMIHSGALSAEQYFSSAIVKLTKGSDITAYVSKGHGECFDAETFKTKIMPGSGYIFRDISLSSQDIPEDADILIVASPQTDYSSEEIEKIDSYLNNGGDIQILADVNTGDLTNLFAYMSEWGAGLEDGMAGDDDQSSFVRYKTYILPQLADNEIIKSMGIDGQQFVFPLARPVSIREVVGISATPLATTSDNGFVKQDVYSSDDSFEDGDVRQKSNLAVMFSKQISAEKVSHMFVAGTSLFMGSYTNQQSAFYSLLNETGNRKFCSGIVSYMTDQPSSFYIMPKNIVNDKVIIDQFSVYIYILVTALVIPMAILAWGLITWLKRRHS